MGDIKIVNESVDVNTERKINFFGIAAILLFGSVLGGAFTYQVMDARIDSLEAEVQGLEPTERTLYVNSSTRTSLSDLFQKVDQSVVSIRTRAEDESAQGSGFIYSKQGFIVTNEHVVDGANRVEVTFTDGETLEADIVGMDQDTDLAVLKVEKEGLTPLKLGSLSNVEVGQRAVAIGNPFGLRGSMTSGIISQKGRRLPTESGFSIPNVLQTDAAINPGNSGGPLLNVRGEVVGVNTAIETQTGTFSGVGFAIPVDAVKRVVPELIDGGEYEHPWIGVSGLDVNSDIAEEMDLNRSYGFLIVDVVEDSPASRAGIKAGNRTARIQGSNVNVGGDVIVGINREKMRDITDILLYLETQTEVGEKVNITVIRDGQRTDIPLTLGSRPEKVD